MRLEKDQNSLSDFKRDSFLLRLSDRLCDLTNISEIIRAAGEMLGLHLGADLTDYALLNSGNKNTPAFTGWTREAAISHNADYNLIKAISSITENRLRSVLSVSNIQDTSFADNAGGELSKSGLCAFIAAPVYKNGHCMGCLYICQRTVRKWTDDEIALAENVAKRIQSAVERITLQIPLRESEERTRLAIEASKVAVWEWNLLTDQVYWNKQHFLIFGLPPHIEEPITPATFLKYIHPDDKDRISAALSRSIKEEVPFTAEFRIVREDGQMRWMSGQGYITRQHGSKPTHISGIMFDITTQKEALQALQHSEQRLRIVMDSIADHAIITTDTHNIITGWNPGAYNLFGYTMQEAIGQPISIIFTPEDVAADVPEKEMLTARNQERADDERYHIRKDGSRLYISGVASPLYDAHGKLLGYVKVARDLTQRQKMEQALVDANHRKDEFIAMLGHELRNPLAPIRNTLKILEMTHGDDPVLYSSVELMSRQVDHMVRLVNDLLDMSRINNGKINLQPERIDLVQTVERAVQMSSPVFGKQHLTVTLPEEPIYIHGDFTRIIQIVSNLLNNANKYSRPDGQVRLTVYRSGNEAVISIQDNGIGIAKEYQDAVFETFVQIDPTIDRSQGGLGLGLSMVKQIAGLHGGSVELISKGLGHGSEFIVTLPIIN